MLGNARAARFEAISGIKFDMIFVILVIFFNFDNRTYFAAVGKPSKVARKCQSPLKKSENTRRMFLLKDFDQVRCL